MTSFMLLLLLLDPTVYFQIFIDPQKSNFCDHLVLLLTNCSLLIIYSQKFLCKLNFGQSKLYILDPTVFIVVSTPMNACIT